MSIRHILVPVEAATTEPRLHSALWLARTLGVHLTGLHVASRPLPHVATEVDEPELSSSPEPGDVRHRIEKQRESSRCSTGAVEKRFLCLAHELGVEATWTTTIGQTLDALTKHSLFADIVVVGQDDRSDTESSPRGQLPDQLVVQARCPLLVIPSDSGSRSFGERILVAWHDDAQAKRSVHASIPLLQRARRVEVVSVAEPTGLVTEGIPVRRALRKYLAMHSVPSDYHQLPLSGPIGDTILGRATETGADLIVMGAYHRSRIRERLLGGVTRHILRNARIPILLHH